MDEISEIFKKIKLHVANSSKEWELKTLEEFIISFEKNSQSANEDIAKKYGNIIKNLVREIMLKDSIIMHNDDRQDEILKKILTDNSLYSMFNKLYVLILKSEKHKTKDDESNE